MIRRLIKWVVALLLLPVAAAATRTLLDLLRGVQATAGAAVPAAVWVLAGGFALWVFLYATLPRPVRSYVLAHELTHALWAWLMGAEVRGLKVSADRGSVTVSKSNFLITLAPYFFPLYTVLVVIGYYVLSLFADVQGYYLFWLGAIGFTWGFHFTFTISTLMQHQSDISECGHLFSYVVIYLCNVIGICLWVVIVSSATLEAMVTGLQAHTLAMAVWLAATGQRLLAQWRQ